VLKYFFVILLFLSCSHNPHQLKDIEDKGKLNVPPVFAFVHEGHRYHFVITDIKEKEKQSCSTYLGFLDGKLTYTFPYSAYKKLDSIYEQKTTPEERIRLFIRSLEGLNQTPKSCQPLKTNSQKTQEFIGNLIFPGTFMVALWPLTIATYLSEMTDVEKLELGISFIQTKHFLQSHQHFTRKEQGITYEVFDRRHERIVAYFKKDRLFAWVRGWNPDNN